MNVTAIKNTVLFQFSDSVKSNGEFSKGQTASGIVIAGDGFDSSAKEPRWGNVIAVGPDVKGIKVGYAILIPALRWTEGMKYEGTKFWKTDDTQIVAVQDQTSDGAKIKPLANWVLFKKRKAGHVRQEGLIAVVGGVNETPSGDVFAVGPKADDNLTNSVIYYDDTNFTDNSKWAGVEFSFIKDDSILAYRPAGE